MVEKKFVPEEFITILGKEGHCKRRPHPSLEVDEQGKVKAITYCWVEDEKAMLIFNYNDDFIGLSGEPSHKFSENVRDLIGMKRTKLQELVI